MFTDKIFYSLPPHKKTTALAGSFRYRGGNIARAACQREGGSPGTVGSLQKLNLFFAIVIESIRCQL